MRRIAQLCRAILPMAAMACCAAWLAGGEGPAVSPAGPQAVPTAVRPLPPLPEGGPVFPAAAAPGGDSVAGRSPAGAAPSGGIGTMVPSAVASAAPSGNAASEPPGPGGPTLPSQVLRMVEELLGRADVLAQRRALYAARLELLRAVEVLAAAHDAQQGTGRHSEALGEALRAMQEAADFVPRRGGLMTQIDVCSVAAGHRCRAREGISGTTTAAAALRRYYDYAQGELVRACGGTRHGSVALSMLGKLYVELAREPQGSVPDAAGWALVLQQAAVEVDPNNWVAANELGVLLARLGRYEEALAWLQRSVALVPQAENWRNLAIVHHYLGQEAMALEAHRQATAMARAATASGAAPPAVQWVSPGAFRHAAAAGMR